MKGFTRSDIATLDALSRHLLPEGHELPGATQVGVTAALLERSRTWDPATVVRVRYLVRAWEWSSVASRHLKRFSKLDHDAQQRWLASSYRSWATWKRLLVSALKQLVFLSWASSPEAEDALGYDYRCRRDEVVHGTDRVIPGTLTPATPGPEPDDYHRPGPASMTGAIPIHLTTKRNFEPVPTELSVTTWPQISDGYRERVDVVVVGSGAGGSVVATALAEAGLDVVVLEEGPHVTVADFKGPMFDRFQRFCRDNGMTQVWGQPPIPLPLGRVVGGTTVVNSGTCFRAPDRVLARWASDFGVIGASVDEMAPHYAAAEEFLNVRPVPWELLGPNGMAAHRGAVALGLSGGPLLRNITDCHGCGQCAFGCPTNAKQAMHISYLPRAERAGARIYAGCRVERVVLEGGSATGVEVSILATDGRKRGRMAIDARHVVVCAGAVHTPALLERSGVPDPSRQTGRNLRIHPATGVGAFFGDDIVNWKGTLQSYYIDAFFDSHELMFEATTTVPSIGAGSMPGIGIDAMDELARFRQLATLGFYVSDTSRGRVRRLPTGEVVATYRLNELDAHRMSVGIAIAAEVMLEAGASRVYPGLPGIDSISAREDLAQLRERRVRPHHLRLTAFHPMGTVRMGSEPSRSVVDPFGRHHATTNLWVADASTFPSCVGVNPQMTIMAFAKRTGEKIAAEY